MFAHHRPIGTRSFFHNPLIVLGHGRSGTTALFGGLIHHPRVLGARSECPVLAPIGGVAFATQCSEHHEYVSDSLAVSKPSFLSDLRRMAFESALGRAGGFVTRAGKVVRGDRHPFGKRYWAAKTNVDEREYYGLTALYPAARFVYILRNGCEVIQSRTKFKSFSHLSFERHCREWAANVEGYRFLEGALNTVTVHQEDLVQDPAAVYEMVWKLADLETSPKSVDFVRSTLIHPLDAPTQKEVDVQQMVAERPPAYESWTKEQRSIFKATCKDAMEIAGYSVPF